MAGARGGGRIVNSGDALAQVSTAVVGTVVLEYQTLDSAFQRVGERIVSVVHPAEICIAAEGRNFQRVKHACFGRSLQIRHIGVPRCFTGAQTADGFAIHNHVRDYIDFRISFDKAPSGFLNRGPVEVAKAAAETDQVVIGELLAPEQQHGVVVPCLMNRGEIGGRNGTQIDAANLGPQGLPAWNNRHGGSRRCGRIHLCESR